MEEIYTYLSWKYSQAEGFLRTPQGAPAGQGWSGQAEGRNNPGLVASIHLGCIPKGLYVLGQPEDPKGRLGAQAMRLEPYFGTQTYGKSGFYLHGEDALEHSCDQHHTCLVFPEEVLAMIFAQRGKIQHLLVE